MLLYLPLSFAIYLNTTSVYDHIGNFFSLVVAGMSNLLLLLQIRVRTEAKEAFSLRLKSDPPSFIQKGSISPRGAVI